LKNSGLPVDLRLPAGLKLPELGLPSDLQQIGDAGELKNIISFVF
jgi:hypothetical protein